MNNGNSILKELAEVVRLSDVASQGKWAWSVNGNIVTDTPLPDCDFEIAAVYSEHDDDREPANSAAICASLAFIRTHHAEIAQNAEAAKRLRALDPEIVRLQLQLDAGTEAGWHSLRNERDELKHQLAATEEARDKFLWQVRDTCTRAEKAEKRLSALEQAMAELGGKSKEHTGASFWIARRADEIMRGEL